MKTNGENSAFGRPNTVMMRGAYGLTKREYFAAMAVQGVEASNVRTEGLRPYDNQEVARRAVKIADALIEALNAEGAQ